MQDSIFKVTPQGPMGPEYGSEKYKEQVERIVKLANQGVPEELDKLLLLYVLDPSYSRAAIEEARSRILRDAQRTKASNSNPQGSQDG